jgi:hypothetical protein
VRCHRVRSGLTPNNRCFIEPKQPSSFGQAFEFVLARIGEVEAGSLENCRCRSRKQDFAGLSQRRDPRGNVYRHTTQMLPMAFNLSGMNASSHFDAVLLRGLPDGCRTANRARRAIEHRKESVAARIHFDAAEAVQFPTHAVVMPG